MYPIANMTTSIRNAQAAKKDCIFIPYSKVKADILNLLKKHNYISDYKINEDVKNKKTIKIFLNIKNIELQPIHIKILSKPGLRVYCGYKKIPFVLNGIGDVIISTPKGIMMGREAKSKKLGGELICEVY